MNAHRILFVAMTASFVGCISDADNKKSKELNSPAFVDEDVGDGIDHLAIIEAMIEEADIDMSVGDNGAGTVINPNAGNDPCGDCASFVFMSLGTHTDKGGAVLQLFESEPDVDCVAGTVMDIALSDRIRLQQPGFASTAVGTRSDMLPSHAWLSSTNLGTSIFWKGSLVIDRWDDQRIDLLLVDGESCDFPETSCVPESGRIVFISPNRPTDPSNVPKADNLPPFYSDAATSDMICNL